MLFNTPAFGLFLVIACSLYWALAHWTRARLAVLLVASLYFYACWDARFLLLIGGVTLIDFAAALSLARTASPKARLYIVAVAVGLNLGLLGFWKYAVFFSEAVGPLLSVVGLPPVDWLDIVLPVGISFFTFQGLSYVIDVYRREIPAERSLFRFALYIAFFPQLVAGPIVRARDLLHQLDAPPRLDATRFGRGLWMILLGLMKKVVLADYLAANLVDRVFDLPSHFSSLEVLAAVYGYSLQIYGDFSGYTDIAIGTALLLGFELPPNFNFPYRADGLRDFWHRWHISLSTWLRDYLYIPLGGSRRGGIFTYRNLLITMVLGGLWHGASYNFVLWGVLHGALLSLERVLARYREGLPLLEARSGRTAVPRGELWAVAPSKLVRRPGRPWPRWARVVITFHLVAALWVFFRADTFSSAMAIFAQIGSFVPGVSNLHAPVVALITLGFTLHFVPDDWRTGLEKTFTAVPASLQAAAVLAVLYGIQRLASSTPAPFIYFQF